MEDKSVIHCFALGVMQLRPGVLPSQPAAMTPQQIWNSLLPAMDTFKAHWCHALLTSHVRPDLTFSQALPCFSYASDLNDMHCFAKHTEKSCSRHNGNLSPVCCSCISLAQQRALHTCSFTSNCALALSYEKPDMMLFLMSETGMLSPALPSWSCTVTTYTSTAQCARRLAASIEETHA